MPLLIVYSMSRKIVFFICVLMCGALIALNKEAAEAARAGFALWRDSVMPSLLPFFVCTGIMRRLGLINGMQPAPLMAIAFISGAPGGARLSAGLYDEGSTASATYTAASLNALSPMFVCGAFASDMLGYPPAAIPIVAAQLLAMLVFFVLAFSRHPPYKAKLKQKNDAKPAIGAVFASSVADAATSLLSICGMIVFFSVLMRLMEVSGILSIIAWPIRLVTTLAGGNGQAAEAMLCAIMEAATGTKRIALSALSMRSAVTLGAFAFSFGGLCIMAQSMIFMRIDAGKYLLYKLAQGTLAALIAYFLFPLCCNGAYDVAAVPEYVERLKTNSLSALYILIASMAAMAAIMLICAARVRIDKLKASRK